MIQDLKPLRSKTPLSVLRFHPIQAMNTQNTNREGRIPDFKGAKFLKSRSQWFYCSDFMGINNLYDAVSHKAFSSGFFFKHTFALPDAQCIKQVLFVHNACGFLFGKCGCSNMNSAVHTFCQHYCWMVVFVPIYLLCMVVRCIMCCLYVQMHKFILHPLHRYALSACLDTNSTTKHSFGATKWWKKYSTIK